MECMLGDTSWYDETPLPERSLALGEPAMSTRITVLMVAIFRDQVVICAWPSPDAQWVVQSMLLCFYLPKAKSSFYNVGEIQELGGRFMIYSVWSTPCYGGSFHHRFPTLSLLIL